MHFKEKVLICSVQECLLWQNSSLEGLKSNSADPVKQRKNTPPPAVGFLLPSSQGWLFHCSKRGRNESNCRLLCLCVSTLGRSSCEAPCIADRVGKTGVPGWELLCRDQEELSAGLGRNKGREGLLALTAAGHRREVGMVLLALLTSPGQKTLWVCRLQPWAHSPAHQTHLPEAATSVAPETSSCCPCSCATWQGRDLPTFPSTDRSWACSRLSGFSLG